MYLSQSSVVAEKIVFHVRVIKLPEKEPESTCHSINIYCLIV